MVWSEADPDGLCGGSLECDSLDVQPIAREVFSEHIVSQIRGAEDTLGLISLLVLTLLLLRRAFLSLRARTADPPPTRCDTLRLGLCKENSARLAAVANRLTRSIYVL